MARMAEATRYMIPIPLWSVVIASLQARVPVDLSRANKRTASLKSSQRGRFGRHDVTHHPSGCFESRPKPRPSYLGVRITAASTP